jgi:hypothetical protein
MTNLNTIPKTWLSHNPSNPLKGMRKVRDNPFWDSRVLVGIRTEILLKKAQEALSAELAACFVIHTDGILFYET